MNSQNQPTSNTRSPVSDAEAAGEYPVAEQPCSGTLVVRSSAFGGGAGAASPDVVCSVKRAG